MSATFPILNSTEKMELFVRIFEEHDQIFMFGFLYSQYRVKIFDIIRK